MRLGQNNSVRGYVLAGGESSRFGRDKAMVEIGGKTVLEQICVLVKKATDNVSVIASATRYTNLGLTRIEDRWRGEGPLGGIITALRATEINHSQVVWNLILSCDMPFLTSDWLAYMIQCAKATEAEIVVPKSEHGLEPLCACWRTSAVETTHGVFDSGVRKVTEAMKHLRMEVLDETHWKRFDSAGRLFWNMNTLQDYKDALRVWETDKA